MRMVGIEAGVHNADICANTKLSEIFSEMRSRNLRTIKSKLTGISYDYDRIDVLAKGYEWPDEQSRRL
jgi:hypothetical protein